MSCRLTRRVPTSRAQLEGSKRQRVLLQRVPSSSESSFYSRLIVAIVAFYSRNGFLLKICKLNHQVDYCGMGKERRCERCPKDVAKKPLVATFGSPNSGVKKRCGAHKSPRHIDLKNPKCHCGKSANYGPGGQSKITCAKHKGDNLLYISKKKRTEVKKHVIVRSWKEVCCVSRVWI